jgi:hypothetical protein
MSYRWIKNINWRGAEFPGSLTAIFALKQALSSSGWAVPSWSNGAAVSTDGNTLNNMLWLTGTLSWVRLQMPSSSREFVFQRSSNGSQLSEDQWRVKYVASGGFFGGTATQTPSSTLDCYLCGGGTDASPTFGNLTGYPVSNNTTFISHILVDNSAPYGFCMWGYNTNTTPYTPTFRIFCDPLLTGSYPNSDPDPYVLCCEKGLTQFGWSPISDTNLFGISGESSNCGHIALMSGSITGSNYCLVNMGVYAQQSAPASSLLTLAYRMGTDPFSTADFAPRAFYFRRSGAQGPALSGYKGTSSLFRIGYVNRSIGETATFSTSRDFIRIGAVLIPWDGGPGFT